MCRFLEQYALVLTEHQGNSGISINSDGQCITLEYETIPQKLRGYFLIEQEIKKGNRVFFIHQKPHFEICGPMLDLSGNPLMTVDAVCQYILSMAKLGLNMVMLYMEDSFELPGYPKFGYMRGHYTQEELRRIDDYAYSLGVEVIPSIQTLGHFSRYIPWGEVPAENATVLLPGNEKVYEFIECEIRMMKESFRTDKIHIGMDEANGLGHGRYFRENGMQSPLEIFNTHLKRVLEITDKYNLEAMIWGDMYFTEHDPNRYYEENADIPQHAIDSAPENAELVFWDYYHSHYSYYDKKIRQYKRFPNKVAFAGAVWTWDGYVPNYCYTLDSSIPALECCIDHGIKTVIATQWGARGESFYHMAKSGMAVFSEYCYRGKDCTREDIDTAAEYISGEKAELLYAISGFYNGEIGSVRLGTGLFYCDLLLDTLCKDVNFDELIENYQKSMIVLDRYPDAPYYTFYKLIFEIVTIKAWLMRDLREAYLRRDIEYLCKVAETDIPILRQRYSAFYREFRKQWREVNKPFGYELFPVRFGGIDYRLQDVADRIIDLVTGKIHTIPELDENRVSGINVTWKTVDFYMHY